MCKGAGRDCRAGTLWTRHAPVRLRRKMSSPSARSQNPTSRLPREGSIAALHRAILDMPRLPLIAAQILQGTKQRSHAAAKGDRIAARPFMVLSILAPTIAAYSSLNLPPKDFASSMHFPA